MEGMTGTSISQLNYRGILFNGIEDCRRARVRGDLTTYSESVMALHATLTPKLKKKIKPIYERIQSDVEEAIKKVREELQGLTNPLEQAGYYQARVAAIERENADKLYDAIIEALDGADLLLEPHEVELRRPARKA